MDKPTSVTKVDKKTLLQRFRDHRFVKTFVEMMRGDIYKSRRKKHLSNFGIYVYDVELVHTRGPSQRPRHL